MCITPFLGSRSSCTFCGRPWERIDPIQSGADRAGRVSTIVICAAGGARHLSQSLGADGSRQNDGHAGLDEGSKPLKTFLARYAREKDIKLFVEVTKAPAPRNVDDLSLSVLIPSYILSELKTGFQIGALLFLPFLVIDLVVASVTLSIGMVQLPPAMVSAPFKILLFVLVDGWNLVVASLVKSFY
jgi:flagellar biosynthesis protein FliP